MKRPNGSGTVEVLPDGRARVRVVIDGKRKQNGPIYPNEESARRVLAAWNADRIDGALVTASELTLGSYGSEWLDRRQLHGSRRREQVRSLSGERSVWSRHVLPSEIASMPLTAIRPRDVEAFATELRQRKALHAITHGRGEAKTVTVVETSRPLSRAMQREAVRLIRTVLDDALRAELLERNPAEGVEVARGSTAPRDLSEDWLRWPEVLQLLACEDIAARDRRAYACAIGLALRQADIRAIEVSRIELDVAVPGPGITVKVEKTGRWHRVPIMSWLAPVIREQLESLPSGAKYLFPRANGRRYSKGYDFGWGEDRERVMGNDGQPTILREPSALERAGVKRRVRFHDLRGTCATHLAIGTWGRKWSLHEIQAMLAHSDQRVTERYVRRAADMLAAAAAATPGSPGLPMGPIRGSRAKRLESLSSGSWDRTSDQSVNSPTVSESSRVLRVDFGQPMGNRVIEAAQRAILLAEEQSPVAHRAALEALDLLLQWHAATEPSSSVRGGGEP